MGLHEFYSRGSYKEMYSLQSIVSVHALCLWGGMCYDTTIAMEGNKMGQMNVNLSQYEDTKVDCNSLSFRKHGKTGGYRITLEKHLA